MLIGIVSKPSEAWDQMIELTTSSSNCYYTVTKSSDLTTIG